MDIYNEFKNIKDKATFFRNISNYNDKLYLWNKLNDSEKKGLISRLSIVELKKILLSLNSYDRKKVYKLFDSKKLAGYYKSLSVDEALKMDSELNEVSVVNDSYEFNKADSSIDKDNKIVNDINDNKGNVSLGFLFLIVSILLIVMFLWF